ncbi:MAG TPA: DUF4160 domain-containing protein [Phycisphaerae bacterium]|nr:DUF4160 domain-containing protein [Phycisphaerae bacterium]
MPTISREGPYRLFFYAADKGEPPHVHIERDDKVAKFWLDPVRLSSSGGFKPEELAKIGRIVEGCRSVLLEAWNEYFHG